MTAIPKPSRNNKAAPQADVVFEIANLAIERSAGSPAHATALHRIVEVMRRQGRCDTALQLPLLVQAAVGRRTPHGFDLAAALVLLEAGIYSLDHMLDDEVDQALASLGRAQLLLGSISLISHIPSQLLLALPMPAEQATRILRLLSDGLAKIGAGQMEELAGSGDDRGRDHIDRLVRLKTGERRALYCALGATLGRASRDQVEAYSDFGRSLGMARQLKSDLFDLFGNNPSRDLASGVNTLPLALYREHLAMAANHGPQPSTNQQSAPDQAGLRIRLRESGVLRHMAILIDEHCRQALTHLQRAKPLGPAAGPLQALVLRASFSGAQQ